MLNHNLMPRHPLLVSLSMDFPDTRTAGKPTEPVSLQNSVDAGIGDGDGMVPAHIQEMRIGPR